MARLWSYRAIKAVSAARSLQNRAFFGEQIRVNLTIRNTGWLPLVWVQIHETLPVQLSYPSSVRKVVSLGSKAKVEISYELVGKKRGYYQVGPLKLRSGDVLGVVDGIERIFDPVYLTVYPKIYPLTRVMIPSSSPIGELRHKQPIFEDPSRVIGKRDYVFGDSLRRIDWKTTATTGRLQVKKFEPSIALETAIFLNLYTEDFHPRRRFDNSELSIVVAASLANWTTTNKQAVGLVTNGSDPTSASGVPVLHPRRGRSHLMNILDVLARIQSADTQPIQALIRRERFNLSWGTTLIVITPKVEDSLFGELFQARRGGMNVILVLIGYVPGFQDIQKKAGTFGIPIYSIQQERDLDIWRQ